MHFKIFRGAEHLQLILTLMKSHRKLACGQCKKEYHLQNFPSLNHAVKTNDDIFNINLVNYFAIAHFSKNIQLLCL